MGWDIIEYEGAHAQFRDWNLWELRHFLLLEAQTMESAEPGAETTALRKFVEGWDWLGPGVVTGINFSTYVQKSPLRWRLLLNLLQKGGDRIASFGESIPRDYLEAHKGDKGVRYTRDVPTKGLLKDIGKMCRLLSQHEPHG